MFKLSDKRHYLDAKANVHTQTIYALQAYYNEWADINKLPAHILSRVFLQLHTLTRVDDSESQQWMCVAGICRHWRRVALSAPDLWTYNVLRKPELVEIFARRSGSLPMTISSWDKYGQYPFVHSPAMTEFLNAHRHRITHLRFARYLPASWQHATILFNTGLPNLESVEVSSHFMDEPREDIMCGGMYNPVASPQQKPLYSLFLYGVFTPWESFVFAGLRRLDLRTQVRDHTSVGVPSMDTFLGVLERCPQLEYLRLQHSGPTLDPCDPSPPFVGRKVVLRSLETIILMNEPRDMTYLLKHLTIPINAHHIFYYIPDDNFSHIEGILPVIGILDDITSIHLARASDASDLDIEIDVSFKPFEDDSLMLHAFAGAGGQVTAVFQSWQGADVPATHSHALLCNCYRSRALFKALPSLFPRAALEELHISASYTKFETEHWRHVLSYYPTLRLLRVQYPPDDDCDDPACFSTLLDAINGSHSPDTLLCPKLEELEMFDMTLGDDFESVLQSFLQERVDAGMKLKVLCMTKPDLWKGSGEFVWPDVEGLVDSFEIGDDEE